MENQEEIKQAEEATSEVAEPAVEATVDAEPVAAEVSEATEATESADAEVEGDAEPEQAADGAGFSINGIAAVVKEKVDAAAEAAKPTV